MLKLPAEATQENRPPIFHRPPKSKRQVRSSEPRVARNELPWVMSACAPQLRRSCAINRNNAMPQSLSAVYIHLVFSTKERRPFLRDKGSRKELDVEGYRINNPFHQ